MTPEQKQTIEQYRGKIAKGVAAEINRIAKEIEGAPTSTSCFCSSTQYKAYLKDFYNWIDTNYPNQEETSTNE